MSELTAEEQLIEQLSVELHDIYQKEAKRQGDVRHSDDYAVLSENTKEYDRVLARWHVAKLRDAEAAQRERDAIIAESEPCFEGEPPLAAVNVMYELGVVEAARLSCRTTKDSIAAAIRRAGEE